MFYTLLEAATKYKLSTTDTNRFVELLESKYSHLIFGNPDVSASGLNSNVIKSTVLPIVMRDLLAPSDMKSVEQIEGLRANAARALAIYLAEKNKNDHNDFCCDMRLEVSYDGNDFPRDQFMVDDDETLNDVVIQLVASDAYEMLPQLQK